MFDYLSGMVIELAQGEAVLDVADVGYRLRVSNSTASDLRLNSRATPGLVWDSGSTSAFRSWDLGEPNGNGDCVESNPRDLWNDLSCTIRNGFFCEL